MCYSQRNHNSFLVSSVVLSLQPLRFLRFTLRVASSYDAGPLGLQRPLCEDVVRKWTRLADFFQKAIAYLGHSGMLCFSLRHFLKAHPFLPVHSQLAFFFQPLTSPCSLYRCPNCALLCPLGILNLKGYPRRIIPTVVFFVSHVALTNSALIKAMIKADAEMCEPVLKKFVFPSTTLM